MLWPTLAGSLCALVSAEPVGSVRLIYARGAGAEHCPDERAVRGHIAALLGYDPFDDRAGKTVSATVARQGEVLAAKVEAREADGQPAGEREIASEQKDCSELAAALELAIAIAIDPIRMTSPDAVAPPAVPAEPPALPAVAATTPPETVSVGRASTVTTAPAPQRRTSPTSYRVGVGVHATAGAAPGLTAGGALQVLVRRGPLGLALEARGDLPASTAARDGSVSSSLLLASMIPCLYRGAIGGCLILAVGALHGQGHDLERQRGAVTPYVATGGRVVWDIALGQATSIAVSLDILAPLTPTVLRVSGLEVWRTPPASAVLGLSVGRRFFVTDPRP